MTINRLSFHTRLGHEINLRRVGYIDRQLAVHHHPLELGVRSSSLNV